MPVWLVGRAGCYPPGEAVRGAPVTIKVWIAGQNDPVEIGLYQNSGQYGAQLPSGLWLALTAEQYRDLLRPAPLISFSLRGAHA